MKTTMEIEDELFTQAKALAVRRRVSFKSMVEHALRREITSAEYASVREKSFTVDESGIPALVGRTGAKVTSADIAKLMDEEGI